MFIFNHLPGHIVDELFFKITVILQIKNDTYYEISNRFYYITRHLLTLQIVTTYFLILKVWGHCVVVVFFQKSIILLIKSDSNVMYNVAKDFYFK